MAHSSIIETFFFPFRDPAKQQTNNNYKHLRARTMQQLPRTVLEIRRMYMSNLP